MTYLVNIRATFECEGCGRQFLVRIDEAYIPPRRWSLFDIAVDAVRHGTEFEGYITSKTNREKVRGHTSIQNNKCFCPPCTTKEDEKDGDDAN